MTFHRLCLLTLLYACGGSCPLPEGGGIQAQVDGEAWEDANPQWNWTGTGVQVLTTTTDGWRLTLVAQRDLDDTVVLDLVDEGGLPAQIDLSGTDGFGVVYDVEGNSWTSSKDGSGTLTLQAIEGDELSGCFSFDAFDGDGGMVEIRGGGFVALAL
jgi:hypothetical protein